MSIQKQMKQLLTNAISLIQNRGWCREQNAKNDEGADCKFQAKSAARFCAYGAVKRAALDAGILGNRKVVNGVLKAVASEIDPDTKLYTASMVFDTITDYNDASKDKRKIIRLFNRTLKRF